MEFFDAIKTCYRKYATFTGRAMRSECWWYWLFFILTNAICKVLDGPQPPKGEYEGGPIAAIWTLVNLLPLLASAVRRLHDIDKSGWWIITPAAIILSFLAWALATMVSHGILSMLMMLMALIAIVVIGIFWFTRKGTPGSNRFGPDPLGQPATTA